MDAETIIEVIKEQQLDNFKQGKESFLELLDEIEELLNSPGLKDMTAKEFISDLKESTNAIKESDIAYFTGILSYLIGILSVKAGKSIDEV